MDDETAYEIMNDVQKAFWIDFSSLVNQYIDICSDLLVEENVEMVLGELTSIYGRKVNFIGDKIVDVYGILKNGNDVTYNNIMEALEDKDCQKIYLQGKVIFERDA